MLIVRKYSSVAVALLVLMAGARFLAAEEAEGAGRFTPQPGFVVEEVLKPGAAGSLVAMAFDESGSIIA